MKVGFIGVGEQGAPMAERVLGAGHELLVYARRPEVRAHFASSVARDGSGRLLRRAGRSADTGASPAPGG